MNLPVLMLDLPTQRFDCHSCVRCCRDLVVHLTIEDRRKIDEQGWQGRLDHAPYVRLGGEWVLNHKPAGGCVFLRENAKCMIHAEFGGTAKPLACQLYPFTLTAEGGKVATGIRFDCPSAAKSLGSPLATHKQNIRRLAAELDEESPASFAGARRLLYASADRPISAGESTALVDAIDIWIRDADRSLVDRFIGLCDFVFTLSMAKLARVRDFAELVRLLKLGPSVPVGSLRKDASRPPNERQLRLLRQAIFSHCEHITFAQARASFFSAMSYQWDQLRRARRFIRGESSLLPIPGAREGGSPDAIAAIGPAPDYAAGDVDSLMTRYLRVRLLGGTVFGPGYYGMTAIEGLSSLLLSAAAIGWLARYSAWTQQREQFTLDDVVQAVEIVDRTAGRARELGARSARLRVRYLLADDGLARLLTAHALV